MMQGLFPVPLTIPYYLPCGEKIAQKWNLISASWKFRVFQYGLGNPLLFASY
jgi:hypothetical protein